MHLFLLPPRDSTHHSQVLYWQTHHEDEDPYPDFGGQLFKWSPDWNDGVCLNFPASFTLDAIPDPQAATGSDVFCTGHARLGDGRKLLVAGGTESGEVGLRTVLVYDSGTNQWSVADTMQYRRWYPTVTLLDAPTSPKAVIQSGSQWAPMYVFGGSSAAAPDSVTHRYGLTGAGAWTAIAPNTAGFLLPKAREGHSWTGEYLFGGYAAHAMSESLKYQNTTHLFVRKEAELEPDYTHHWQGIATFQDPELRIPGRTQHAATDSGDARALYVFGGRRYGDVIGHQVLGDVWRLSHDLDEASHVRMWYRLSFDTQQPHPTARYGHTMLYDSVGHRALVFGGVGALNGGPSDSSVWEMRAHPTAPDSVLWKRLTSNTPPVVRHGHTLTRLRSDGLGTIAILFGGNGTGNVLKQDIWLMRAVGDNVTWTQINPDPQESQPRPAPRMNHSAIFDKTNDRVVIFGGTTAGAAASDSVWAFKINYQTTPTYNEYLTIHRLGSSGIARSGQAASFGVLPEFTRTTEIYDPTTGQVDTLNATKRGLLQEWYPFNFVTSQGKLFNAGPSSMTYAFDFAGAGWDTVRSSGFKGGSAVMYRPDSVMKSGTRDTEFGTYAVGTTKSIAATAATPAWTSSFNSMIPRTNHNLVILPSGDVLAIGGTGYVDNPRNVDPVYRPELWNPDFVSGGSRGAWYGGSGTNALANNPLVRGYHSSAILLPDGRVLSAGGDSHPDQNKVNLYCPPYLFTSQGYPATRPSIIAAHDSVPFSTTFHVNAGGSDIRKIVLIRPGSATHGFDQDQRYVPLSFSYDGTYCRYVVQSPATAGIAPRGYYMLFVLDAAGVPSVARWIKLGTASAGADPPAPCGGGCPMVEVRTEGGFEFENSILNRSLDASAALDDYRLTHTPSVKNGTVELLIRENEQERTTLDEVRLIAIDREPGQRTFTLGDRVVLGTRHPASRITHHSGLDLAGALDGAGPGFEGQPGDTLLVEFTASVVGAYAAHGTNPGGGGGIIDDGGGKDPPGPQGLRSGGGRFDAQSVDAQILSSTGMLLQVDDGAGGWRTLAHHYPREQGSEAVFDSIGTTPLRVVFVGRHFVRFIGRLHIQGELTATKLPLISAQHSRLGSVLPAVESSGNLTTTLVPGDSVSLNFSWHEVPAGLVRDLFLLSRGLYTASLPATQEEVTALPSRFALRGARPNPSRGATTFHFDVPKRTRVSIEVFDVQGRSVTTLANRDFDPGSHSIEWRQSRVQPGVYLCRMTAGRFREESKVVLAP